MIKEIFKNKFMQSNTLGNLTKVFVVFLSLIIISFVSIQAYNHKISYSNLVRIEPIYPVNLSDDKVLLGASHNVFVGKVIQQIGTKERGIGPETQFSVQVIDNIKGDLRDTVTVDQEGGYKDGVLYAMAEEGDTLKAGKQTPYLLQAGATYLFATRYNKQEDWYTLNSFPTASKILDTGTTNLDSTQLKTLAENDSRVKELQEAYKNEVPLDADVKNNNELNSYKSVQEKATQDQEKN